MPGSKNSQSDYDEEKLEYAPVHYRVYLQFNDGATTILPVSIDLLGYRKRPFVSRPWNSQIMGNPDKVLSPWYMAWDKGTGAGLLLDVFRGFPLLVVNDAKIVLHPAYGSTEYVKGHMTVYPPRVMATTWGLHTALRSENRLYPLSLGCAKRPLLANKTFRWRVDHIPKGLLRFTDLKMLVAEVRGYRITVEVPGKVYPVRMIDLDKIKIQRPAVAKSIPRNPTALVNGAKSCSFAYDCLGTDTDETGLCSLHSERLHALLQSNPRLTGILPSHTSFEGLEWAIPKGKPTAAVEDFLKILRHIHTYDQNNSFSVDFEGLPNTRLGLAALPTQIGIVNVGTTQSYMGFIGYKNATPNTIAHDGP